MKFKILCVLLLSGLTACAQVPTKKGIEETGESTEQEEISQVNLPKQELTAPILFDFLVGETALQRGNLDVAVNRYVKLAKTTRDPRIAKRASEIATQRDSGSNCQRFVREATVDSSPLGSDNVSS